MSRLLASYNYYYLFYYSFVNYINYGGAASIEGIRIRMLSPTVLERTKRDFDQIEPTCMLTFTLNCLYFTLYAKVPQLF